MNIGEAARTSSVSAKMIRHYEAIGLLPPSSRSDSGYRIYSSNDLHTLRFIGTARSLGFSLDEIRQLVSLWQDRNRSSGDVKTLVVNHITQLEQKIAEMSAMRDTLRALAETCDGNARPDCPILHGISTHCAPASGSINSSRPGAKAVAT